MNQRCILEGKAFTTSKNEQILVRFLQEHGLKLRIARDSVHLERRALKGTREIKSRHHAIAALNSMAEHENYAFKPRGDQVATACDLINKKTSSNRRIQADCLIQLKEKSKVHVALDDIVKNLDEQHSFEAWTQPGSRLGQSPASRCTPPHMDRAHSTKLSEVVASKAPKSFKLETAAEEKNFQRVTAESLSKNAAVTPEH